MTPSEEKDVRKAKACLRDNLGRWNMPPQHTKAIQTLLTALQSAEQERDKWKADYDRQVEIRLKDCARGDKLAEEVERLRAVHEYNVGARDDATAIAVEMRDRAEAAEAKLASLERRSGDVVGLAGVIRKAIHDHTYSPSQEFALSVGKGADVPDLADFLAAALAPLQGEETAG